jgi:hypothetical protein
MTVNLATALIKSTGSTTSRSLGARAGDIINVKDFGAVGDGVHDDTTNVQAAFDAAFGPASSPHGNANRFLNVPVYFPAGTYKITAPLYLTYVVGGWIFGAGENCTRIEYGGSLSGNTVIANGITPLIMTNGFSYSRMERLNLAISGANTTAFYLFQDGTQGTATGNTFLDLLIEGCTTGLLAGYGSNGLCSECIYINVTFGNCTLAGLRTVSQNALNHSVYGGGGFNCGTVSTGPGGNGGACYSCVTGSISPICDISSAGNGWDIINQSSNPVSIIGGRTESTNCIGSSGSQIHCSGLQYNPAGSSGAVFIDISNAGFAVLDGCNFAPGGNTGAGTIVALGSSGVAILDNFISGGGAASSVITGSAGSKLYLRGCVFSNASTIAAYTGTVGQNI